MLYSPWNSPGQNTEVGSHSLLQGIFPSQGWNPGLPHCGRILYCVSHQGSPNTTSWLIFTECWQSVKNFLSWRAYIHMHISQWLIHSYHYSQMGFSHMCKVCDRCSCVYTCVHIHVYIYAQFMCECGCVSKMNCASVPLCVCCSLHTVSISVGPKYKERRHVLYIFAQMFQTTKVCSCSNKCSLPQSRCWLTLMRPVCEEYTSKWALENMFNTCSQWQSWNPGPSRKGFHINHTT